MPFFRCLKKRKLMGGTEGCAPFGGFHVCHAIDGRKVVVKGRKLLYTTPVINNDVDDEIRK